MAGEDRLGTWRVGVHSERFRDVMLVLFTICVIGVFLYALVVEPILDHRRETRLREPETTPPPPPGGDEG
jgi:hypothetical protein